MKKIAVVAAAAVVAFPAAAHAQAYVQVQAGLDSVSVEGESEEGVAYGGAIGYDFALTDNWFVGVEGSIDDSTTKACVSDVLSIDDEVCVKTGRDLAVVGRIGTKLGEASQIYVLGGYTNARIKATYDDGVDSFSEGDNGDGFRLGAGYRLNFSENMFGKLEYRYSNYESDFSRHNALVAVGMSF
ncbi:outer membrane protein [Croceicoccus sp. Ery15]|uniref:outer membrane protein n=1 Tax=Croceicoccus sp. Ery15 TaxID=1703338 RepID=UPI001E5F434B|nr:outer membrane beta-barrel protein [Croceicoccus sp. Ery15]